MRRVRLPRSTPPEPIPQTFDVVISQSLGLPVTGSIARAKATGGSEWQVVVLAEALVAAGLSCAVLGPFFAYAFDRGVHYIPIGEVGFAHPQHGEPMGRRDAFGNLRNTSKVRCRVLVSERFGGLPLNVEFERVVFDLHDIPDDKLAHVAATCRDVEGSHVVVHSQFTASLLDSWPSVRVIPCMVPDEFYRSESRGVGEGGSVAPPRPRSPTKAHFVYGSAALKGLQPTLELWRALKASRSKFWRRATLTVTSPGYDRINHEWLKNTPGVEIRTGLSPAGMQTLLGASDGIFMVSTFPETFGIVFHQAEIAGVPAYVLRVHGQEDALETTLANPQTLFEHPDTMVSHIENGDCLPLKPAKDFSVSTILPQWLDVLGIAAAAGGTRPGHARDAYLNAELAQ